MIEFNATFIVAMLSFIVFMFIMNAIFYRPILNIIRKREDYIESNYRDAKDISQKAQEITNEYNEKLSKAKDKARHDTALKIDAVQKEEFSKVQLAKENSKTEIQSRKEKIEVDTLELKEHVNSEVVSEIANDITSKIIGSIHG
ncbi:hypothetical protein J6I39_03125 [bacterium]|nr:hypothetical protein [bacterium]